MSASGPSITEDPILASKIYKFMQFVPYTTLSMVVVLIGIGIAGSSHYRTKIQSDYTSLLAFLKNHSKTLLLALGIFILLLAISLIGFYLYKNIKKQSETKKRIQDLMLIQRNQLMRLYRSTGGDRWRDHTRWGSSETIDRWKGIHINHQTGRIIKIILPENKLIGPIPEDFFIHFPALVELDLRLNELTGPFPPDLLNCRMLEGIYLFDNYLTGSIPDELSDLPRLGGIYLFNNNFTGTDRSRELFKAKLEERPCFIFI